MSPSVTPIGGAGAGEPDTGTDEADTVVVVVETGTDERGERVNRKTGPRVSPLERSSSGSITDRANSP
ncbi:hypothetical protein ACLI4Q_00640 [Natrialbaceae archaeon A-CW1-1]